MEMITDARKLWEEDDLGGSGSVLPGLSLKLESGFLPRWSDAVLGRCSGIRALTRAPGMLITRRVWETLTQIRSDTAWKKVSIISPE